MKPGHPELLEDRRDSALLDAIPDLMFRVARDGTFLDVHANDPSPDLRPPEELIGTNVRDVVPRDVADAVLTGVEQALDTGTMSTVQYELSIGGVARFFESRIVPSGDCDVVGIVRDFTDQRRAEAEQRRLAEEQAALRRVATRVAGDAPPEQVFQAVTEEVCRLLGIPSAALERFDDAETSTIVGRYGDWTATARDFEVGSSVRLEEGLAALDILRTGKPVPVHSFDDAAGDVATRMRALGLRSVGGVPIAVGGATWGALIVGLSAGQSVSPETERRMEAFAELVALAVASAQARDELAASRRRIVEAADLERKRIERNLHDATQQRLTSVTLALGLAESKLGSDPEAAQKSLAQAKQALAAALTELRDLSQDIHPSVLSEGGLEPALEDLAYTAPLPVRIAAEVSGRLAEQVEAGAYYVVAEALTNVAKHACASSATVTIVCENGTLRLSVRDDGIGGADSNRGSGLRGLADRVHALGGTFEVESPPGQGTEIRAAIPCE